jgi:hypothetical protein
MTLADRLDDWGKPAWIALVVLGFVVFWPLGFVALGYMIGSRRMGCWGHYGGYSQQRWQERIDRFQQKMERAHQKIQEAQQRMHDKASRWAGTGTRAGSAPGWQRPSGNHAFDEYREETLRRLEEEQREFMEFLERLRHAKDKAEFDQFMADRRGRPENRETPQY